MSDAKEAVESEATAEPTVVDKNYCASILVKVEKKEAPYWDVDGSDGDGCCSEDRPDLLAQCDHKLEGFLDKIAELCPHAEKTVNDDFQKVDYVEDLEAMETASQHTRPAKPMPDCPDPCEAEHADCPCHDDATGPAKALERTPDGKPVEDWAAFPAGPSADADEHLKAAQEDCGDEPCKAEDYKDMPAPKDVSEES